MQKLVAKKDCVSVNGILLLDKSSDMTSNKALQIVKGLYKAGKAGHTGTLDYLASGLLPICFGEATKISQFILNSDKTYAAEVLFGYQSSTGDLNGSIVKDEEKKISNFEILNALKYFEGDHMQIPPMYSAVKNKGLPLYKLAKKGKIITRQPRKVTFFNISLKEFNYPIAKIIVKCSKGTYIRQFAEDLGSYLKTKACLYRLRRLSSGPFDINNSYKLRNLSQKAESCDQSLARLLLNPDLALLNLPALYLSENDTLKLNYGQEVILRESIKPGLIRLYNHQRNFFAVGEALKDGRLKSKRILKV